MTTFYSDWYKPNMEDTEVEKGVKATRLGVMYSACLYLLHFQRTVGKQVPA